MDKHLLGLSEFIRKHGLPKPWCSVIQSAKTPIIIATRPATQPAAKTGGESVRVVGGYNSPRVDKARWGDMELVLELPKARYAPNEAIPVKLMIRNTGRKDIRLDGILPMRSSANPPSLDIEAPGHRIIRLLHGDGIVRAVRNEKTIVVAPNETIVLIDADLRRLSGTVQDDNGEPKYQKVLAPFFGNGEYTIRGTFMPTPQIYASSTPKARFRIRAGTQPAAGAAEIDRLIKQLGSEKVTERKEAQAALIGIGRSAEARLLAATKDAKLERAHRAELALQEIQAATLQVRLESVEQLCIPGDVPRVRLEVRNIGDQPMRLMPLKYRGKLLNVSFRVRMLGEAGAARDCGNQAVPVGWAAPEPVEVRPGEALTVENQCMPSPAGTWGGKPWEVIAEYVTPRGKVISASAPVCFRYLAKLEFRIAPRPSAMGKAELRSCMDWLKAGRVGFWWKGGRVAGIAGRMPNHAWLPIAGELTNADQLVTGEYKGRKYVLVSDKSGQTMLPGKGKNAWYLAKAYATKGGSGRPAVGFELDARGAELFAALTKANIRNALAIVVDDKVVSAPVLMSPLGRKGMITGRFSAQKVKDLVNALNADMASTPDGASTPVTQPSTTRAPLDLDDAAKRLTQATGVTWRVSKRPRAPGLGAELWGVFIAWHGVAVPYSVLPFALDEQGKAKLELFRKQCSLASYVIASDDRCIVLAGFSHEPDVTAKVLAVLGVPESKECELRRRASASAEWLDFRLAVARDSGAKGDHPLPLANGPTIAQIKGYKALFAAKGPNGGRHRGDPFLWFHRMGFCELSPLLVTTESKNKAQYVLLSNRPGHVLLSGSARPRPWHFKRVYAATDPQGRPAVGLELDAVASKRMGTLTGSNIGRPLAVLFHGDMLSVFTIEAKITSKLLISGDKLDKALVDKIVRSLSECMLADNETLQPSTRPATPPATQPSTQPALLSWGKGPVRIQQGNSVFEGKRITVEEGRMRVDGNAILQANGAKVDADRIDIRLNTSAGSGASTQPVGNGAAKKIAVVRRVYDVRDLVLVMQLNESPAYWDEYDPNSSSIRCQRPGDAERAKADEQAAERQNLAELIEKIKHIDPNSWLPEARTGSIAVSGGKDLVISQTEENQARVSKLIGSLRNEMSVQVKMSFKFIRRSGPRAVGKGDDLPAWLGKNAKAQFDEKTGLLGLSGDEAKALLAHVEDKVEYAVLSSPVMTIHNGQRNYVRIQRQEAIFLPRVDKNGENALMYIPMGSLANIRPTVDVHRMSVACELATWVAERAFQGDVPGVAVAEAKAAFTVPDKGAMLFRVELTKHKIEGVKQVAGSDGAAKMEVQHSPIETGKQEKNYVYVLVQPEIAFSGPVPTTADLPMYMPAATEPATRPSPGGTSTKPAASASSGQADAKPEPLVEVGSNAREAAEATHARFKLDSSSWLATVDAHEGKVRIRIKDAAGELSTWSYSQIVLESAAGISATTGPALSAGSGQAPGTTGAKYEVGSSAIAVIDVHAGRARVRFGGRTLEAAQILLAPATAPATQPTGGEESPDETVARVYDLRDLVAQPDSNAASGSPASPLAIAAGHGHLDVVKLLVARGANVNPAGQGREGTPLTAAAHQGRREVVEFLLEKGAKLDGGGKDGNALISAVKGRQVDIVRLLLDKGLDVNLRTKSGQTPLIALVRTTWSEPAKRGAQEPAKKGVLETARLLLDRGVDVNARDSQGYTALSHACYVPFSKPGIDAGLCQAADRPRSECRGAYARQGHPAAQGRGKGRRGRGQAPARRRGGCLCRGHPRSHTAGSRRAQQVRPGRRGHPQGDGTEAGGDAAEGN